MQRKIKKIIQGFATQDGAGVKLTRVIGARDVRDVDPFLMLDAFDSTNPADYTAGFPFHPHRGIETFTYLIHGKIEHQDSLGNKGLLTDGGAQWMTAGSGIIHQEMPMASDRMLGLQLWINLPKKDKMTQPAYWDITEKDVVRYDEDGVQFRIISGEVEGHKPQRQPKYVQARILDITIPSGKTLNLKTDAAKTLFVYTFDSDLSDPADGRSLPKRSAVLFEAGDVLNLEGKGDSRILLFEGLPLHEPVAFGGPIVMNTEAELQEAFRELRNGTFIKHR